MSQDKSAVVVGAGVSGLICARKLLDAGWHVRIVDKARGVGGRLSARRVHPWGSFDIGAQFMTARDPRFQDFLAKEKAQGKVALWTGSLIYREGHTSTPATSASRWVGVPGMNGWIKNLCPPEILRLEHTVRKIEMIAGTGWILDEDPSQAYDEMILALPAPQAAALIPSYSPLKSLCLSVTMEPCWTVYAAIKGTTHLPFDGAFVRDPSCALSWMAKGSSKPGRTGLTDVELWVLQASPQWTHRHFDTPAQEVESILLGELRSLSPSVPSWEVVHQGSHRWRYASSPEATSFKQPLTDADLHLSITGDWIRGGRIEGAFLAGWELGEALICKEKSLGRSPPKPDA